MSQVESPCRFNVNRDLFKQSCRVIYLFVVHHYATVILNTFIFNKIWLNTLPLCQSSYNCCKSKVHCWQILCCITNVTIFFTISLKTVVTKLYCSCGCWKQFNQWECKHSSLCTPDRHTFWFKHLTEAWTVLVPLLFDVFAGDWRGWVCACSYCV